MVRIITKQLYTQIQYSLLREKTECFSKLLCLLRWSEWSQLTMAATST